MKAALIQKSTQELIKKDQYPNLQMDPVVGLDEDLEWLLIVNKPIPTYDSTTHKLVKLPEQITNTPHEEYSYLNQYVIESVAVEMTPEEIESYSLPSPYTVMQEMYKEDGIQLFDEFFVKVETERASNSISEDDIDNLTELMYSSIEPLYRGVWRIVGTKLDQLQEPTDQTALVLFNWIKDKVSDYININY